MTILAAAPVVAQSLSHTATTMSLLGITIVSLILALFIRRRVPRLAASVSGRIAAVGGTLGGRGAGRRPGRTGGRGRGAGALAAPTGARAPSFNPIALARAALGWIAILLFALAGVAASGTFIGTLVLGTAHLADRFFMWIVGLFPNGHTQAGAIGVSIVGLLMLALGLHLAFEVVEGNAHHGGRDWLVFAGPMLFTMVPGYFGQWSATVYAAIGSHVGPIVAHLV